MSAPQNLLQTPRLDLRQLTPDDAPFVFELVNEPSWLRHIGDRHVHTLDDAVAYINNGPVASYAKNGHGLYLVVHRDSGAPAGLCGLLRRDSLPHADIGFAFSPRFWGQGLAYEAAAAVMADGRDRLGLATILAIVNPDNERSIALLEKIGMRLAGLERMPGDDHDVKLYTT